MKIEKSRFNSEASPQLGTSPVHIYQANEQDISVIKFEGVTVRVVNVFGEPWFVAKDICEALGIINSRDALKSLDKDERNTVALNYGNRGNPNHGVVAESGFYKLISRSRKATTPGTFAHRFINWVFRDVIPGIRKTGAYGVPYAHLNDHSKRQAAYNLKASERGSALQACKAEKARLAAEEAELWRKYQPKLPEVN